MSNMKLVDMHCDTLGVLLHASDPDFGGHAIPKTNGPVTMRQNPFHISLEKLQKGNYLLQNFAVFVFLREGANPLENALQMIDLFHREMETNKDIIAPVYTWQDIEDNRKAGKMSAMLTLEEGGICKGDLAYLRLLHRLGARMMTLTWNFSNEIGNPNNNMRNRPANATPEIMYQMQHTPDTVNGLTEKGIEFLAEMERLGMIPDVSHLSDAGFYDVLAHTTKPFVASHSNARAVCSHSRNLTDDMIRKLAERGGVTGLNFCADFLTDVPVGTKNPGTIQAIVDHARHITNVGGIDCLGLGTDFDGIETHQELPDASYMPLLVDALKKGGFTESQLDKILGENVLRVYKDTLPSR